MDKFFNIKKIGYILYLNEEPDSGIFKKVKDTIITWNKFGIESKLYILTNNHNFINYQTTCKKRLKLEIFVFNNNKERIRIFNKLVSSVINFNPNIVYFRYTMFLPSYIKLAKSLPVVIEVNTHDIYEKKLGSTFSYIYNLLTRNFIFSYSKGLVCVTSEIATNKDFTKFKKPILALGNGINLERFPILPSTNNKYPRLVFMGNGYKPWHGVDKILLLAKILTNWKFDIIGINESYFSDIPHNINFYGFLKQNQYIKIFKMADCA
ncbi:MAG: hypothetical protein ACTSPW_17540, partial [Promethearchaeota archaeon]